MSKGSKRKRSLPNTAPIPHQPSKQNLVLSNKFSLFNEDRVELEKAQNLVDEIHNFVDKTAAGPDINSEPIIILDDSQESTQTAKIPSEKSPSVANTNPSNPNSSAPAASKPSKSSANKKNTAPKEPSKLLNDSTTELLKVKDWGVAQEVSSFAEKNGLPCTLEDLNPPSVSEPSSTEADDDDDADAVSSNGKKTGKSKSRASRSACGLIDKSTLEKNAAKAVFNDVFGEKRSFSQFASLMDKHNFSYLITEQNVTRIIHKCNEIGIRASYKETVRDKLIVHIDTVRRLAAAQKAGMRIDLSKLPPCRITKTKKTTTRSRRDSVPTNSSFDKIDKARTRSMSGSTDFAPFANNAIDYNFSANDKLNFGGDLSKKQNLDKNVSI